MRLRRSRGCQYLSSSPDERVWSGGRCPPGHGDIYPSLLGSGFLDRLLSKGIKYLFVSNSDNLGATLDVDLLAYFANTDKAFLMEVTCLMLNLKVSSYSLLQCCVATLCLQLVSTAR